MRLDLSSNRIVSVPAEISQLAMVEQIWLNDNYLLNALPESIEYCRQLKVLDLRRTNMARKGFPHQMGRLKKLIEVCLQGTPFREQVMPGAGVDEPLEVDTEQLMADIAKIDRRTTLTNNMLEKVLAGIYREVADTPEGQRLIPIFVKAVCNEFKDLDELRNVVRNCDRLFPEDLNVVSYSESAPVKQAKKLRKQFVQLQRQNEKKKMSAELELKLRAIYYDMVEPKQVEQMVEDIYYKGDFTIEKHLEIEDIQFMIKNASRIFPTAPKEVTGHGIRQAVWDLQDSIIRERLAGVEKLGRALCNFYSDREPPQVHELAAEVSKGFFKDPRFATKKELEEIRKLAADAAMHFPSEFHAAKENPVAVKISFKRSAAASQFLTT